MATTIGLPQILITFQTQALTLIQRSERGIVALILLDDNNSEDTFEFTDLTQVTAADWTPYNYARIKECFLGKPAKIIVERLAEVAADDSAALTRLVNKKFNWLAIPGADGTRTTAAVSWINTRRTTDLKTFKAVVADNTADNEGIVNFTTDAPKITVGDVTFDVTVDTGTDFATADNGMHGLANGDKVTFGGDTLPAEVTLLTEYYVVNKTEDTFQVATTSGGTPINFSTAGSNVTITIVDNQLTTTDYTARLAGLLAGLPLTRSSTYVKLSEISSITESSTPDDDIKAGKFIIIYDGTNYKIGRGVNSFTSITSEKGETFAKIKIIEAMDQIKDDIRTTFSDYYIGLYPNDYEGKKDFIAAVNVYFDTLVRERVLDNSGTNRADIDTTANQTYMISQGEDITDFTVQQVREYNTGDNVYLSADVKILDAMEDLTFAIKL